MSVGGVVGNNRKLRNMSAKNNRSLLDQYVDNLYNRAGQSAKDGNGGRRDGWVSESKTSQKDSSITNEANNIPQSK